MATSEEDLVNYDVAILAHRNFDMILTKKKAKEKVKLKLNRRALAKRHTQP